MQRGISGDGTISGMSNTISIQGSEKKFGGEDVFFIAEIGKGFIQSKEDKTVAEYLQNAKDLVDAAVASGADAVKFQTHEVEDEVLNIDFTSPHFKGSDRYSWVTRNMNTTPLEEFWKPLKAHCDEKGILFFSTPMSRKAAMKLDVVGVPFWKVGSGDVQDHVLLNYLIASGKPIIISTGMVSLAELDEVISYITGKGAPLVVLYCISQYPCPPELFNMATIDVLKEKYPQVVIGFSDHSITHDAVKAALAHGAKVIEKHFSFSRELWGSDHKASLLPDEFKEMVRIARTHEYESVDTTAFDGDRNKELEGAGNKFRPFFNKALMAGKDIAEGTVLTENMIYAMRPVSLAGGLPADRLEEVVGKKTTKGLKKFDPITLEVVA